MKQFFKWQAQRIAFWRRCQGIVNADTISLIAEFWRDAGYYERLSAIKRNNYPRPTRDGLWIYSIKQNL